MIKFSSELIGNAIAFLNPLDWAEQFGYVMIESMACGTPVVARRIGSVPEVFYKCQVIGSLIRLLTMAFLALFLIIQSMRESRQLRRLQN